MPWQLSGNGRSGWSTKLIRGLKAEAAAGFQSRRERCREPTPVTPQYAAFPTYKVARVHHDYWRCSGVAAMSALPPINNPLISPFGSLIQIKEAIWQCKTIRPGEST
jgi:hypothetical protein